MTGQIIDSLPAPVAYGPLPLVGTSVYLGDTTASDWLVGLHPELEVGQSVPYRLDLTLQGHHLLAGGHHADRVALTESLLLQVVLSGGEVVILDPHDAYRAFRGVPGVLVTNDTLQLEQTLIARSAAAYAQRVANPGVRLGPVLAGDLTTDIAADLGSTATRSVWLAHGHTFLAVEGDTIATLPEEWLYRVDGRLLLGDYTEHEFGRLIPGYYLAETPHLRAHGRLRGHHVHATSAPVEVQFAQMSVEARWLLACLRAGYTADEAAALDRSDSHVVASVEMMGALRG